MAVITTYVCDVSGVSSNDKKAFIEVSINTTDEAASSCGLRSHQTKRLVHRDVATRLHIINLQKDVAEKLPEPTFENKLGVLLRAYIE